MVFWLVDSLALLVVWTSGGFVVSEEKQQQEQTCPCSLFPSSGSSRIKQQKWDTASQGGQVGSRIDHPC